MKQTTLLNTLLLSLFFLGASAQQNKIEIVSSTPEKTVVRVLVNGFDWKTVQTPNGEGKVITLENGIQLLKVGEPDLPVIYAMVPVPEGSEIIWNTAQVSNITFENMIVAPSPGKRSETEQKNNRNYTSDGFFPRRMVEMKNPVVIDGENKAMFAISPIQYNPELKTLKQWNELIITITAGKKVLNTTSALETDKGNTLGNLIAD